LNNTASGSQSAVVAGNGNIASGQYSFAIGINSTASGTNAFASGNGSTASQNFAFTHGQTCTANQFYAVAMGNACTATANYGFSHGNSCVADGVSSRAGGEYAIARGAYGVQAYASGAFTAAGDAQVRKFTLRKATTDATATVLSADAGTATAANSIVLPTGSSYHFEAQVVARQATTGDSASWTVRGLAKNVAGTCSIVGTPSVVQDFADTGATTWALAITANNTLKSIAFGITGEAAKSLKWIADVRTVEVVG
jgi:hypothetical protein